jgi:hypothetical protein
MKKLIIAHQDILIKAFILISLAVWITVAAKALIK